MKPPAVPTGGNSPGGAKAAPTHARGRPGSRHTSELRSRPARRCRVWPGAGPHQPPAAQGHRRAVHGLPGPGRRRHRARAGRRHRGEAGGRGGGGAHTWIFESSPPHGSQPRLEDGYFAGARDVADYLLRIANKRAAGAGTNHRCARRRRSGPVEPGPGRAPPRRPGRARRPGCRPAGGAARGVGAAVSSIAVRQRVTSRRRQAPVPLVPNSSPAIRLPARGPQHGPDTGGMRVTWGLGDSPAPTAHAARFPSLVPASPPSPATERSGGYRTAWCDLCRGMIVR
ncbi:hypothetical protein DWB77_07482 [Streptomyces hundungensis]|uniref:Uncharacterized protein n=1 Tax=Streptomyces hundungensis TaxID=1077946 RepID=A0A387HN14_9ACTN|nr:hypothetical protein DWB77_07482 [Streptomyces hundungensis]